MFKDGKVYLGLSSDNKPVSMDLAMANRHGLIAGASGTGKTITMKVLAESFADAGVPVFMSDIKGDVSGIIEAGESSDKMEERIDRFAVRDIFQFKGYTTTFWDVYGQQGHPVRATISDMGPDLLSQVFNLTEAQEGVLNIIFKIADDKGLLLTDLKDLKAMIAYVGEHRKEFLLDYGNITSQSLGGITRALIPIEAQGGDQFFGQPDLDIHDWIRTDSNGKGMINLLNAVQLVQSPKLYAMFLLWLMSELFESLPEAGDSDKPKLVFFFDEAHLLFTDTPKILVQKIEQVVKLIRSKGVGIYFVTQSPADIPDPVLAQLSNRIQHALRAYTPAEQKAVKTAAESFRPNPSFDTSTVISTLGVGQALVSTLDGEGIPQMVEQTAIILPQSKMAPAAPENIQQAMADDGMSKYDQTVENDSAYELLQAKQDETQAEAQLSAEREAFEKEKAEYAAAKEKESEAQAKAAEKAQKQAEKAAAEEAKRAERRRAKIESQVISTASQLIKRGILNTLKKHFM